MQDVLCRGEKLNTHTHTHTHTHIQLETVTNRTSQLSAETRRFKDKASSLYRELLLRQVSNPS